MQKYAPSRWHAMKMGSEYVSHNHRDDAKFEKFVLISGYFFLFFYRQTKSVQKSLIEILTFHLVCLRVESISLSSIFSFLHSHRIKELSIIHRMRQQTCVFCCILNIIRTLLSSISCIHVFPDMSFRAHQFHFVCS